MNPQYIQLRRGRAAKGWTLATASNNPLGAVSCVRPHRWGNEFAPILETGSGMWRVTCRVAATKTTPMAVVLLAGHEHPSKDAALADAVDLYRLQLENHAADYDMSTTDLLADLRGRDLACYCAPGEMCHVQRVLLPMANER